MRNLNFLPDTIYKRPNLLINLRTRLSGASRLYAIIVLVSLMQVSFSQETTYNDSIGDWSDNSTWLSGTSPGSTDLTITTDIYGYVTLNGDLNYSPFPFTFGTLNIFDTLVIVGDLNLGWSSSMNIGPNGILIVQGNMISSFLNGTTIDNQGQLIVTGEVYLGLVSIGDFTNTGEVYLFDDTPQYPFGGDFTDVDCPTCTYDEEDLEGNTGLDDFFNSTDATAPVPDVDPLMDLTDVCGIVALTAPIAVDNYTDTIVGTHNATLPIIIQGTTVITWTYDDGNGNTSSQDQNAIITDSENPTITAPTDVIANTDISSCDATGVALGTPTTSDNCTVASVVSDAVEPFTLGSTTVTWTVTDNAGLTATATQTVTVTDIEKPTITAPANVGVATDIGSCTATGVALGTPVTTDNCSVASTVNDSPGIFPQGETIVTWTVTDGSGNTEIATQTVTVTDNELPTITAPIDVIVNNDPGLCTATGVVLGVPVTADNCTVASVVNDATEPFALGSTTVLWTVTDDTGLTATDTQTVTVIDNTKPTITAPANITIDTDAGLCTASGVTIGTPTTADNCSIASVVNDAAEPYVLGVNTITWTVTDGSGNTETATQTVLVEDNIKPTITAPINVTINTDPGLCTATGVALGTPATSDNCTVVSVVSDAVEPFVLGTTTVTWTVTDGSGNTETATQTVLVEDNTKPTITAPADVTVDTDIGACTATGVSLGVPITADNCTVASVVNDATEPFALGSTTVLWTVTDASGNTETATQIVLVEDNTKPTITAPANITIDTDAGLCTASGVTLGTAVAADNCTIASVVNDATEPYVLGVNTITWTVTDGSGNTETAIQTVLVEDNVKPTITAPINVTVNTDPGLCTATGVALGSPTTSDNCTVASVVNDAVEPFVLGTTTVTWTVTDGSGNTETATQTVLVEDNTKPTITAPADVTVDTDIGACTATGVSLGVPITADNCTVASVSNDAIEPYALGTTIVTWTVTDGSGNIEIATQTVLVEDNTKPTITAPANVSVDTNPGTCNATTVALGTPTTDDNCTVASVVNDAVEPFELGTTTVTWTVTDGSGNTEIATQTVLVEDNTKPTITAPADVTVGTDGGTCDASGVTLGTPTTADNCSIGSVVSDAVEPFALGSTTVTWTVTDGSGNTETAIQIVLVEDNTKPTITAPANITVETDPGTCAATGLTLGTSTTADNCSIASVVNNASEPYALGLNTITWTVTDGSGNTETAIQTILVEDNTKPSITAPADITVDTDPGTCTASGVTLGTPITSDNCTIASVVSDATEPFALGATTVTWTITDGSGNFETATQTVLVEDNTKPTISAPADITIDTDAGSCTATGIALGTPTTADNCTIASVVSDAVEPFALGITTVTWTVTDGSGNTETATQTVLVEDNSKPTITSPADIIVSTDISTCTATGVALGTPTTSDNCTIASVINDAVEPFALGTTTVTWTITDGSGNTEIATQIVTVNDSINPSITAPVDVTVTNDPGVCTASSVALGTATTSDNCGVPSISNDAPAVFPEGITTVTWTSTDNAGLSSTDTQTVTVFETEDPVITNCPADIIVTADDNYCGSIATWTAPTVTDNCSFTVSSSHSPGDYFLEGTTTVTYTATDGSGNSAICSFDVTVGAPPALTIEGETTACSPGVETYSLSGLTGKSFSWSVNEGTIIGSDTSQTVDINWTNYSLGTISVFVTSDSGCTANGSLIVSKIAGPETSKIRSKFNPLSGAGYLSEICPGDTGLYYAVTGLAGSTFSWNVNGVSVIRDFGDSVVVNWNQDPGEHEISVVETSLNSCAGDTIKGSVFITVLTVELGNDTTICEGDILNIIPLGDYETLSWHDGSSTIPYVASSEELITCTVSRGTCTLNDELYVTVNVSPQVDLGNDTAICNTIILDAGADGINYDWSTGEITQQIEVSGIRQEISVEVENSFECFGRDTILIESCDMKDFFRDIPNMITPNSDGKNDEWIIDELEGFPDVVVEIYDRWGRLVFRSEEGYQTPWNGTNMNGNPIPTGAYHYVLLLNYGDYKRVTGSVSVIR